jgi:hypothetical protein
MLQAAVLGLGAAGLASAAYQSYGMARDRRRYRPPGELVDIGGRKLHLLMAPGAGPPLVIVRPPAMCSVMLAMTWSAIAGVARVLRDRLFIPGASTRRLRCGSGRRGCLLAGSGQR